MPSRLRIVELLVAFLTRPDLLDDEPIARVQVHDARVSQLILHYGRERSLRAIRITATPDPGLAGAAR
jgi:hypothetical protein